LITSKAPRRFFISISTDTSKGQIIMTTIMPPINSPIVDTLFGLIYSADSQEYIINPSILVVGEAADGVRSDYDGSVLDNFGEVVSGSSLTGSGVKFNGNNDLIVNERGAVIAGTLTGIIVNGNNETIKNYGSVSGFANAGVDFGMNSNHVQLINHGTIITGSGPFSDAVYANSQLDGGIIRNYGTIGSGSGDGIGIDLQEKPGLTTHITNHRGAVIAGGGGLYAVVSAVVGDAVDLRNAGTIDGAVLTGARTGSTIVNHGRIKGAVDLLGTHDTFNGKGGASGDIYAGDLYGYSGNDVVIAGKGNLSIHIGTGDNTLTGGTGHDKFVFDSAIGGHVDLIKHFNPQLDTIVLSESDFHGFGPHGTLHAAHFGLNGNVHNGGPQIVYNESNGFLYYDANGDHPGGQIHFATLAGHPPVGLGNFLLEA
jgi:Ca2+-binding RTX toxin-like protein